MNSAADVPTDPWASQRAAIGAFIRHQREMSNMSLRQLSQAAQVSNAYLSQIERGLHDPTLRVLVSIGNALHVSVDDLLGEAAQLAADGTPRANDVEQAIRADGYLRPEEKDALIAVYRSYRRAHATVADATPADVD